MEWPVSNLKLIETPGNGPDSIREARVYIHSYLYLIDSGYRVGPNISVPMSRVSGDFASLNARTKLSTTGE